MSATSEFRIFEVVATSGQPDDPKSGENLLKMCDENLKKETDVMIFSKEIMLKNAKVKNICTFPWGRLWPCKSGGRMFVRIYTDYTKNNCVLQILSLVSRSGWLVLAQGTSSVPTVS